MTLAGGIGAERLALLLGLSLFFGFAFEVKPQLFVQLGFDGVAAEERAGRLKRFE